MLNWATLSIRLEAASPWLTYLAVFLIWLTFSYPWLSGQIMIPWDSKIQFYPWMEFVQQSLHRGELPLWNPYLYSGYPMVADPQAMLFSPLLQIGLFLLPEISFRAQDSLVLLHLLLAGLGAAALGRSYGWPIVAVLLFSAIVMFGGVNSARLQHSGIVIAYGYFPFALFFLKRTLDSRRIGYAVAFGLFAGAMALHMTLVPYLLSLLLLAYAGYRVLRDHNDFRASLSTVGRLALGGVIVALVMLPQAVPTFMTLGLSNREAMPLALAYADSIRPEMLATLTMPDLFGHVRGKLTGYWGTPGMAQTFFYIGLIPLLALLACPVPKGRPRDWGFFCGLLAVSATFMFGGYTPLYPFLHEYLPGLSSFRRPADGAYVLNVALAFLAACSLADYVRHGFPRPAFHRVAHPLIAIAAAIVAWLLIERAMDQGEMPKLGAQFLLFLGVSAALLLAAAALRRWPMALTLGLGVLALADLRLHTVATTMNGHAAHHYQMIHTITEAEHPVATFLNEEVEPRSNGLPPRIEFHRPGPHWDNSVAINGFFSTTGNNPFGMARYDSVVGMHMGSNYQRRNPPSNRDYASNVFDLLGARYVVSANGLTERRPENGAVLDHVFEARNLNVWENPNALPRVFMPQKWRLDREPEDTIESGQPAGMDFRETVMLEKRPQWPGREKRSGDGGALADGKVEVTSFANNEIVMEVKSSGDGMIFLSEVHHPAWTATVNGEAAPLYRANYAFRAVPVPEGRHTVTLSFRPYRSLKFW